MLQDVTSNYLIIDDVLGGEASPWIPVVMLLAWHSLLQHVALGHLQLRMWSVQLSPKDEKKAQAPRLPEPEPVKDGGPDACFVLSMDFMLDCIATCLENTQWHNQANQQAAKRRAVRAACCWHGGVELLDLGKSHLKWTPLVSPDLARRPKKRWSSHQCCPSPPKRRKHSWPAKPSSVASRVSSTAVVPTSWALWNRTRRDRAPNPSANSWMLQPMPRGRRCPPRWSRRVVAWQVHRSPSPKPPRGSALAQCWGHRLRRRKRGPSWKCHWRSLPLQRQHHPNWGRLEVRQRLHHQGRQRRPCYQQGPYHPKILRWTQGEHLGSPEGIVAIFRMIYHYDALYGSWEIWVHESYPKVQQRFMKSRLGNCTWYHPYYNPWSSWITIISLWHTICIHIRVASLWTCWQLTAKL